MHGYVYVVCGGRHLEFAKANLLELLTPEQSSRIRYRAEHTDIGLILQQGTLLVDTAALTDACVQYLAERPERAKQEADWLRQHDVAAALCDMPLWSISACEQAGVPLLYVGNFTWTELYREFLPEHIWKAYAAEYRKIQHGMLYALHNPEMLEFLPRAELSETSLVARPFHPDEIRAIRARYTCPIVFVALGMSAQFTQPVSVEGIEPTYPSEKYGYIIPIGKEQVSKVSMFKEKPTQEVAKDYIAKGALWNGGVFAFKLGYVLNRAHELIDFVDYEDLFNKYDTLNKISFDYAVVEHEPEIEVMRFAGTWKDLGTWNTLTEAMDSHAVGEAMFNEKCENVHVVNELDVPILCMGLKDVVVSASPEGILVSDKEQSSYIKPYVNTLDHRVMFAEKSWGSFKVIDIDKASMTIKVTLNAGHQMNYHSHQHRDEVWTVIAGEGKTIVDGMEQNVKAGDVITMSAGCRHTVIAETELKLIEVQLGEAIDVHDKQKFELEY